MRAATNLLLLAVAVSLAACGFHLRGHGAKVDLAFKSVYLKAGSDTPFVASLRNALTFNKVVLTETPDLATVTLEIVAEASDKQVLALSGTGQVREYRLRYRVTLRAYDKQLNVWLPEEEIVLIRTFTYDDKQVLAKEQEEALLFKDMRTDAVVQAIRRLSRAKPQPLPQP